MQNQGEVSGAAALPKSNPSLGVSRIQPPVRDFDQCEALMMQHIKKPDAEREAELFTTKWYDYRRIHPINATYLFVWHYNRMYGDYLATTQDRSLRYVAAVKGRDIFTDRAGKGHTSRVPFFKLRQKADALGMPYDVFTRAVGQYFMSLGWSIPPSPQHASADSAVELFVLDAWHNTSAAAIQWADHDFYTTPNWVGHPDQLAYENRIVAAIKARPVKRFALHTAIYERQALRIERALAEFALDDIADAVSLAET